MSPFNRQLVAACGYLELGMPLEANEEIESIEPELKTLSEVLAVRVDIFRALGKWELMEIVARQLCHQRPDEPGPFISLGYATRRAIGLQEALAVLATVANRFPTCAVILYNIACYAAQLGQYTCPGTTERGVAKRKSSGWNVALEVLLTTTMGALAPRSVPVEKSAPVNRSRTSVSVVLLMLA